MSDVLIGFCAIFYSLLSIGCFYVGTHKYCEASQKLLYIILGFLVLCISILFWYILLQ